MGGGRWRWGWRKWRIGGSGDGGRGIGGKDGRKEQVAKLWNQIRHCDHANFNHAY